MRRYALIIMLLAAVCGTYGQQPKTYAFAERDTTLRLDIYYPDAETDNGYTIVHVYGGGFVTGCRTNKWDADYCRQLADNGYTAVAIDYRLGLRGVSNVGIGNVSALEHAFYIAVEDCSAAIAYLVTHSQDLGIDPKKIIIEGSSAGAITALMTDFARCNKLECARELPADWAPAGVVAYGGAIYSKQGKAKWQQAEPAPTLLFHGTDDRIVPYKKIEFCKLGLYGADAIVKRLDKYNLPYCVYRYTDLGHEVSIGGPITMEFLNLFVRQYVIEGKKLHEDITIRDEAYPPSSFSKMTLKDLYKNNK